MLRGILPFFNLHVPEKAELSRPRLSCRDELIGRYSFLQAVVQTYGIQSVFYKMVFRIFTPVHVSGFSEGSSYGSNYTHCRFRPLPEFV